MTRWRSLLASILGGFVSLVRGGLDQVLARTMISPRLFHPRFSIRFFFSYLVASLFTDVVFSLLGFSPFLLTPAPRLPLLPSAISISIFVDSFSGGRTDPIYPRIYELVPPCFWDRGRGSRKLQRKLLNFSS